MAYARSAWHLVAAISGATAIGMGGYGAHGFKPTKEPEYFKEIFLRGQQYHLVNSLLLAVAPFVGKPNLVGGLAAAGIVLFSGSCYSIAVQQKRDALNLAPIGGFALIGAWLALAL